MKEQSNSRMKLNETIDLSDIGLSKNNSMSMKDFGNRGGSPPLKAQHSQNVRGVPPVHAHQYLDQFHSVAP